MSQNAHTSISSTLNATNQTLENLPSPFIEEFTKVETLTANRLYLWYCIDYLVSLLDLLFEKYSIKPEVRFVLLEYKLGDHYLDFYKKNKYQINNYDAMSKKLTDTFRNDFDRQMCEITLFNLKQRINEPFPEYIFRCLPLVHTIEPQSRQNSELCDQILVSFTLKNLHPSIQKEILPKISEEYRKLCKTTAPDSTKPTHI